MDTEESEEFIKLLASHQGVLFSYIRTFILDSNVARDILQETNIILWKKMGEFEKGSKFLSWSRTIAHYQVLAWCRDRQREKVVFNDNLISLLVNSAEKHSEKYIDTRNALKRCRELLPEHGQQIIDQIYDEGLSVTELADRQERTANSISQILHRMRTLLRNCMNSEIEK